MTEQHSSLPRILIADDSKVVRLTFKNFLKKDFEVLYAEDGVQALQVLEDTPGISVLFSDLGMPNMDGYELIQKVRASSNPQIRDIPIVVVTAADDSEGVKSKVIALGATDLISKPFDAAEIRSRASSYAKYNARVSELEKHQAHDALTGLSTKKYFLLHAEKTIAFARRHGHEMTVVRISIDHFPQLTQKLGKSTMAKIIKMIAGVLTQSLRQEDDACWLGGEHFVLVLPGTDPEGSHYALQRVCDKTANFNLRIGGEMVHIGFSIGTASQTIEEDETRFADLMKLAEGALAQAIHAGGGQTAQAKSQLDTASVAKPAEVIPEVSLDQLLESLATDAGTLGKAQLLAAMRKFMPVMKLADQQLKLGLAKVILHLEGKLR